MSLIAPFMPLTATVSRQSKLADKEKIMQREIFDHDQLYKAMECLFQRGFKTYLACTGAGAGVANLIWLTPGASSTLAGFEFPYSQEAFNLFVGKDWAKTGNSYCGQEASIAMAQAAYLRCQETCFKRGDALIGIGLTAAAETSRTLRGGTRCFAAIRTDNGLFTVKITMEQGFLGREGDGAVCDLIAANCLLYAAGLPQVPFADDLHLESDRLIDNILDPQPVNPLSPEAILFAGSLGLPLMIKGDKVEGVIGYDFPNSIVFPGSFNPFHFGHDAIARTMEETTGKKVIFEITASNADKAKLPYGELVNRSLQFFHRWPVILRQDAGLFVDKAVVYPGAGFIVGADTAKRILDESFYGGADGLNAALRIFTELGTKFYVIGRDGMPSDDPLFRSGLFIPLPGRWPVSSSDIRNARL